MADKKLVNFVTSTAIKYGEEHVVYNVHQLTHLADSVTRCGPLWTTSAFPFEGHNQNLLNLFNGTNYICSQIANSFMVLASLPPLLKQTMTSDNDSVRVYDMVRQWLHGHPLTGHAVHVDEIVCFGVPHVRQLTAVVLSILQPVCDIQSSVVECFDQRQDLLHKTLRSTVEN